MKKDLKALFRNTFGESFKTKTQHVYHEARTKNCNFKKHHVIMLII